MSRQAQSEAESDQRALPKTVLLIDDDSQVLESLLFILAHDGYRVMTALDGEEGLVKARQHLPDIVFLDIIMPGPDGITVCERLKGDETTKGIPVVMLTSVEDSATKIRALSAGANEFLTKPVSAPELLLRVRNILQLSDVERIRRLNEELEKALASLNASRQIALQQEKLATIGQLSAGIIHEITTPLSFVSSNLSRLASYVRRLLDYQDELERCLSAPVTSGRVESLERLSDSLGIGQMRSDIGELLSETVEGLRRMGHIVQELRCFIRKGDQNRTLVDLNDEIRRVVTIVGHEVKGNRSIVTELDEGLPLVLCVGEQLGQVVMNLLVNALHAVGDDGRIVVRSGFDRSNVWISVADDGPGIAPELREKIFEPFFSGREKGRGTGLGLSISADIVRNHDGDLLLECGEGGGATFTVRLPLPVGEDSKERGEGVSHG